MTKSSVLYQMQRHQHAMIWVGIYCIMILLTSRHQGLFGSCLLATVTIAPMMIDNWVLRLVLLPLLHKRPYVFTIGTFAFLMVLVGAAASFDQWVYETFADTVVNSASRHNTPEPVNKVLLHSKYAMLLMCTTASVIIDDLLTKQRQEAAAFREQQMQEQLKYLRAQINPHFLFNALNCIYTLTMIQDEKAPDSVLKLSEMLRYVIDDCRADRVPLSKEVKYIRNYIEFQRIRMEHEPNLTIDVQQNDPQYMIPPMILQPIIENCFKHSRLVDDPKAWIHIQIRQNESGLLFTCDNSKPAATTFSRQSAIIGRKDEERTGIGLMNVQQRLAMLFGDKCSLKVIEDDTHYKTVLHI